MTRVNAIDDPERLQKLIHWPDTAHRYARSVIERESAECKANRDRVFTKQKRDSLRALLKHYSDGYEKQYTTGLIWRHITKKGFQTTGLVPCSIDGTDTMKGYALVLNAFEYNRAQRCLVPCESNISILLKITDHAVARYLERTQTIDVRGALNEFMPIIKRYGCPPMIMRKFKPREKVTTEHGIAGIDFDDEFKGKVMPTLKTWYPDNTST